MAFLKIRVVAEKLAAAEEVMKAVLALVVIYIGTFLVAIQGASQNSVQAAPQDTAAAQEPAAIDPAKAADIRALMELVGARDAVQDASAKGIEQFRENLTASIPGNDRGQQFINEFVADYQKKFNADDVTNQLVGIYDKHFSDEEIKGLLQFYGTPLGQKYAAEVPRISRESQAAGRAVNLRVAKEVMQELRREYPGVAAHARLLKPQAAQGERPKAEEAQARSQPANPQP